MSNVRLVGVKNKRMVMPSKTGMRMIFVILINSAAVSTGSQAEARSKTQSGVSSGARRVEVVVMATERARSPWAR